MRVRILNHREISNGVKEVTVENVHTKERLTFTLTGQSYKNFIKYVMYLWSNDLMTSDVITKIVNKDCYCFYRV